MTGAEALTALAPIVGSGGIVGALIAYLGYKGQASKGRPDPVPAVSAVGAIGAHDLELLSNTLSQVSGGILRLSLVEEYRLKRVGKLEEFEEFIRQREMEATLEAFKAEQKARTGR